VQLLGGGDINGRTSRSTFDIKRRQKKELTALNLSFNYLINLL